MERVATWMHEAQGEQIKTLEHNGKADCVQRTPARQVIVRTESRTRLYAEFQPLSSTPYASYRSARGNERMTYLESLRERLLVDLHARHLTN
ncbi:hypothetical protein [Arthrobacter antibioticus]|uniref:hypothetical protein n=1 Tax=Arthrobacter sp. H35-MC1 TaxID=3046203 RepID=UPI0024BB6B36|nr:hypothetical protein [Arthrobacter sp. H35-MC1]MDJ0317362.1 hypothetical protein [Arthrobacter sp. H35-MC1]